MIRRRKPSRQTGHLIIVLMVGIAISSIMLGKAMESWQTLAVGLDSAEAFRVDEDFYVEASEVR